MSDSRLTLPFGVTITRSISASAQSIYDAWTVPEIMRTWFAKVVEADVRVGGLYRIENHEEDGTVNVHLGEFKVLEPPRRIVQTFRHDSSGPGEYEDEYLEITLEPLGSEQTRQTLINAWSEPMLSAEDLDALRAGWNLWLEMLEERIGARARSQRREGRPAGEIPPYTE